MKVLSLQKNTGKKENRWLNGNNLNIFQAMNMQRQCFTSSKVTQEKSRRKKMIRYSFSIYQKLWIGWSQKCMDFFPWDYWIVFLTDSFNLEAFVVTLKSRVQIGLICCSAYFLQFTTMIWKCTVKLHLIFFLWASYITSEENMLNYFQQNVFTRYGEKTLNLC